MNLYTFALKEDCRQPLNVVLIALLPTALLIIPAHPETFPFGLYLYGMVLLYSAFLLTRPVVEDRMKGIVVRIAASPISHLRYLGSHLLAYFTLLCIQILLFCVGILIVHKGNIHGYGNILLLYVSFSIMAIAFALAWNTLFRAFNLSFGIFSGVGSVMCLISGVSLPPFLIPESITGYTMFLPTYWLPYGLDAIYHGEASGILISHVVLWAYAIIFLLVGSKRRL
jgi:ABC-2 type transport system permease protein